MKRNPAILLSLILLLLIGGGGVAFYLHLRKQAPPPFSEVDAFLRQFPTPPDWSRDETVHGAIAVSGGPPWLEKIGIRRDTEIFTTCYCVVIPPSGNWVSVDVAQDSQKISGVWIHADPPEYENLRSLLLEKFPTLRGSLRNDNIP